MKERGMIFNSDMVKAILEGRKTQTRRPVVGKKWITLVESVLIANKGKWVFETLDYDLTTPYGKVGDRLWVRETWFYTDDECFVDINGNSTGMIYRADDMWDEVKEEFSIKWKPSIHIPRWASRITLEITDIRVERVQDINDGDCYDEGFEETVCNRCISCCEEMVMMPDKCECVSPKNKFIFMWQSIYRTWEQNPYVWVIEFKVIRGKE